MITTTTVHIDKIVTGGLLIGLDSNGIISTYNTIQGQFNDVYKEWLKEQLKNNTDENTSEPTLKYIN